MLAGREGKAEMEILNVRGLSFAYRGAQASVLKNISFSLAPGSFTVLMGDSGSGKSTLLRLIKKDLSPEGTKNGSISLLGKPMEELTARESAFAVGFVAGKFATKDSLRKGVVWQCAFRSNFAIIGLPLATALGGENGAAVASVLSAFAIPLFNVCSVGALTLYTGGNGKKMSAVEFLKEVFKNPLTLGVLSGLVALLIRSLQGVAFGSVVFSLERDVPFLYKVLVNLKSATTPLALLILGGQCVFSAAKGMFKELAVGTVCRILIAPFLAVGGAVLLSKYTNLLQCGNGEYAALIALFGAPVAVSSAIVAGEMGNDEQLASQLVVWTSVGSLISIFLFACVMMGTGLLVI